MVGFMISMVTLLKGLKHIGIDFDLGMGSKFLNAAVVSAAVGLVVAIIGAALLRRIKVTGDINSTANVEKVFGILMIFTACGMAFAHGSNDVANAVGPLAAVVSTVQSGGLIGAKSAMPWWVLGIGAAGIVIGLATYGWRVIQTIGRKITELTPSRGLPLSWPRHQPWCWLRRRACQFQQPILWWVRYSALASHGASRHYTFQQSVRSLPLGW
jgi:PiT family inorganic phosphate transporter